ncbi:MAG: transporter substrate-binding domain-containing protein [Firmicutes bacterium]|nr:transporter substrate-binding domain-containing protein [Bacillota bacterium]
MNDFFRRSFSLFLLISLLICSVIPVSAENGRQTVRVGYVLDDGYQEGEEGQHKTGYGYEYLQKIRYYTDWEYEYIYGSFSDLLDGVKNGTVDLMGNISMTGSRAEEMYFGEYPQGSEDYLLVIHSDDTSVSPSDYSTLNGKKVGINKGSVQVGMFEEWLQAQGLTDVKIVEYSSAKQRVSDLKSHAIDAMVVVDLQTDEDLRSIATIGSSYYYFVVSKEKPWLKQELDEAQGQILSINTNYNDSLYIKYHDNVNSIRTSLTEEEMNWIAATPVVTVGYPSGCLPYCTSDDSGSMTGMYREYFDFVSQTYGITFAYREFSSYADILRSLDRQEIDIAIPMYFDYWVAEENRLALTDPLIDSSITYISSSKDSSIKADRIAVSEKYFCQAFYVQAFYPNAEIIYCPDFQCCLNEVNSGTADCTFFNSDVLEVKRRSYPDLAKMHVSSMHVSCPVSIAVRQGSGELMSILNKGIALTSDSDTISHMVSYTRIAATENFSLLTYMTQNTLGTILFISGICLLILVIVIIAYARAAQQKALLQDALDNYRQADYDRRTDFLTGLHSRQDMFETLQESVSGNHSAITAMYMIDIDYFKKLNDNYGHTYGDECLRKIGEALLEFGREHNMNFYRYGGEEMLGIAFDPKQDARGIAAELVQMIAGLNIHRADVPTGCVTVSLGYTTDNKRFEKMIDKADTAMYQAKDDGRNRFACYEDLIRAEKR